MEKDCQNSYEINKNEKNLGGRPLKSVKYKEEQASVIAKLNKILGITETNSIFHFSDIDNNIEKQNQIKELEIDVKKYYNYGGWSYFAKEIKERKYMSLVKTLYDNAGYTMSPIRLMKDKIRYERIGYSVKKN